MSASKYLDIIDLPHYISKNHPQMNRESRAAQFAPFAALVGHSDAVDEVARLTDRRIEIDDDLKEILNTKLQLIAENIDSYPEVTFTYFIYDNKKSGGEYVSVTGNVKRVDLVYKYVILTNNKKIPINEIIDITGDIFKMLIGS